MAGLPRSSVVRNHSASSATPQGYPDRVTPKLPHGLSRSGMPRARRILGLAGALLLLAGCMPAAPPPESPAPSADPAKAECGDEDRARHDGGDSPEGRHRPGHRRRQGGCHPGSRQLDDGGSRDDEHAFPQRRGRDLVCLHAAADPRRREEGRPRRQVVQVAAGRAELRPGHSRTAGANDLRLRRLRHRQHRVQQGAVRRSVPAVGTRPAARLRDIAAASL